MAEKLSEKLRRWAKSMTTINRWASLFGLLFIVILLSRYNSRLQNQSAPAGYFSFEFAVDQGEQNKILETWSLNAYESQPDVDSEDCIQKNNSDRASVSLLPLVRSFSLLSILSWLFLTVLFGTLISHKVEGLRPSYQMPKSSFGLVALALLCDVGEKAIILQMIEGDLLNLSWLKFMLFSSKMILLVILIVGLIRKFLPNLRKIVRAIRRWLEALWFARLSLVLLVVLFFLLFKVDQGQDLLLTIPSGAKTWMIVFGVVSFYGSVSILAWIIWFLPRWNLKRRLTNNKILTQNPTAQDFVDYVQTKVSHGDDEYIAELWQDSFKWLGVLTFLIASGAAYEVSNIATISTNILYSTGFGWILTLVLGFISFYVLRMDLIKNLSDKAKRLITVFAMVFIPIVLISMHFLNDGSNRGLKLISLGMVLLGLVFLLFTSVRAKSRREVKESNMLTERISEIRSGLIAWIENRNAFRWVIVPGIALALWFVINQLFPSLIPSRFNIPQMALFNVLSAIVFYVLIIASLPLVFSKKKGLFSKKSGSKVFNTVQVVLIALIVLSLLPANGSFHDVATIERKNSIPTIEQHMQLWLADRIGQVEKDSTLINQDGEFPIFLVNSHGGGIAAAAWTNIVLSSIESMTKEKDFGNHIYSLSGASGGSVGSAVYCAFRKEQQSYQQNYRPSFLYDSGFFSEDFLSPIVTSLLGRDLLLKSTEYPDRSDIQESMWSRRIASLTASNRSYSKIGFSELWQDDSSFDLNVPLLFSNTYLVEKGQKGIVAPVRLNSTDFPGAVLMNELTADDEVTYMAGTFVSARFPYMSPAGRVQDGFSFYDGGIKDNSGSQTSLHIAQTMERLIKSMDSDIRFAIHVLSIRHFPQAEETRQKKSKSQPLTPVTALYNNLYGTTRLSEIQMQRFAQCENYFSFHNFADEVDFSVQNGMKSKSSSYTTIVPAIPLGWTISRPALCRYLCSIKENADAIEGVLESMDVQLDNTTLDWAETIEQSDCSCT